MSVMSESMRLNTRTGQEGCGYLSAPPLALVRANSRTMAKIDVGSVLKRIDRRLKALDMSANAAGTAAGSRDMIRSIRRQAENGSQKGVSTATIARLAPVLKTTEQWLLNATGPETADDDEHLDSAHLANSLKQEPTKVPKVRLMGYVGAGAEAHYYALADEDYDEVDAPLSATDRTVALEIKGTSFGPLMNTWLVYYNDVRSPVTDDLLGQVCVVGLADDRILIKEIRRERDGSYTLRSNSISEPPIFNAQIEWAARVTDMKPRR